MQNLLNAHNFLTKTGDILVGDFSYEMNSHTFSFHPTGDTATYLTQPYFVEGVPVEVHFHGISHIDFSDSIQTFDLIEIQRLLQEEGTMGIPTIFLDRAEIDLFTDLMDRYADLKAQGELDNIIGLSLEGPLLLSKGGTPPKGNWDPTHEEWQKIAACGCKGLRYIVISPDWQLDKLLPVAELLLSNGIYLCLGHPRHEAIKEAVEGIYALTTLATDMGFGLNSGAIVVDHLFNDMPRKIKHAWRSISDRRRRSWDLLQMDIDSWELSYLPNQIGEVPATLIQLAQKGLITLFLNFDGQHVDLQICRRIYEIVGAAGVMPMTDRIETNTFGGLHIVKKEIGTLWYQENGCVAVGSSTVDEQMNNMRMLKISERDIWNMCSLYPTQRFLSPEFPRKKDRRLSYVDTHDLRIELTPQNKILFT